MFGYSDAKTGINQSELAYEARHFINMFRRSPLLHLPFFPIPFAPTLSLSLPSHPTSLCHPMFIQFLSLSSPYPSSPALSPFYTPSSLSFCFSSPFPSAIPTSIQFSPFALPIPHLNSNPHFPINHHSHYLSQPHSSSYSHFHGSSKPNSSRYYHFYSQFSTNFGSSSPLCPCFRVYAHLYCLRSPSHRLPILLLM